MTGKVIESRGSFYTVKGLDNKIYTCILRGKFKLEKSDFSNPITVGDNVNFLKSNDKLKLIDQILPRNNCIYRESLLKNTKHLIACNIDDALLISPPLINNQNLFFLDKFLALLEYFDVNSKIIFNKIDLLDEESKKKLEKISKSYMKIGYDVIQISALKNINLEAFKKTLYNKTTLLVGNSGVGKSTIINKLAPGAQQKVGEVSKKTNKGRHTTTYSAVFDISAYTFIIDTPGIQYLDLSLIKKKKFGDLFKEFCVFECKYHNCSHLNEPECGIKKAVEEKKILLSRYTNYKKMLELNDGKL